MPDVISEGGQTIRKNSYAASAEAKLTLRVNGEEQGVVITPQLGVVLAGFEAPTVAPVASSGGAGSVPEGYYVYRYAYASSRYPFVANAVTAGGEEWPRSSPSPASNTFQVTGGTKQVSVQVTYTTRSDVDYILIYRTLVQTTAADAEAFDEAGDLFYVGSVANNTAGGTTTFTDNEVAPTNELMELDNYVCPLFYKTVFDGFYWWGFGNQTLEVVVTLDGTDTFSIDSAQSPVLEWFSGRDGYTINFYGITTGGYDGRGNYYFEATTSTTGQAFVGSDMVTPTTIPAVGYTTAYLTAPATTLYRSKQLNPFSWGRTTVLNDGTKVPELWAERIGGGVGTAVGLIPNERILKLDTEAPQKSYALDLNAADNTDFLGTLRTLDEAQSTGSHFSQFPMRDQNAQTTLASVNAKAYQILSADGQSQIPIGDPMIETLKRMQNDSTTPTFYHGVFDYRTELNCWWVKTTDSPFLCDTLIYQHSNSGKWGFKYTPGITASCTVFDSVTNMYHTFVGDSFGRIGSAFEKDVYSDLVADESTLEGTWFATPGEAGFLTLPAIGVANVTIHPDGTGSGLSALSLTNGAMYLANIPNDGNAPSISPAVTRIIITDGVAGTFISASTMVIGAHTDVCVVNDFSSLPVVVTRPVAEDAGGVATQVAIMFSWQGIQSANEDGDGNLRVDVSEMQEFGVTIPDGDYEAIRETVSGRFWNVYVGATACAWLRYFNGGNPERNKRTMEFHLSQENVGEKNALRVYPDYGLTIPTGQDELFNLTLTNDPLSVSQTVGSVDWFTTAMPSGVYHAFGIHMLDVGYEQYRALDFTIKLQPS